MNDTILFTLIFLIIPLCCFSQTVVLHDSFEDGDLAANPAWAGDTGNFTVSNEDGNLMLKLDAEGAGRSGLVLSSRVRYGSWEFFVRFDFSTLSGSNNLKVMIIGDQPQINNELNGFVLQAGEAGSGDRLKLIRYEDGDEAETILTGTTDINGGGDYRVRLDREPGGNWSLYTANSYDLIPTLEVTGNDNTPVAASWFGFFPVYTTTRSDKFFFDDITISKFPIELASVEVLNNRQLRVAFIDSPDPGTVQNSDFSINNGVGIPDEISTNGNTVKLTYYTPIPGGDFILTVQEIRDSSGTPIPPESTLSFSLFDLFEPGDIVINEFMYDEPEELTEYVELKNTSSKRFDLNGWKLGDAIRTVPITADTLILPADGFLVLTGDRSPLHERFGSGRYIQLESFPALNNTGDAIRLHTPEGITADSLFYSPDWGGNNVALERRSVITPSSIPDNWGDSPHPFGGTPGAPNEVELDLQPPAFLELTVITPSTLRLLFSEPLKAGSAANPDNYRITPAIVIERAISRQDTVFLHLSEEMVSGTSYELESRNLEDIFGNRLISETLPLQYIETFAPRKGDLIINEIMYDPLSDPYDNRTDQSEYVELKNISGRAVSLEGFFLHDLPNEHGNVRSLTPVSTERRWIPAGGLLIVHADTAASFGESRVAKYFDLPEFDSLSAIRVDRTRLGLASAGDAIYLTDRNGEIIDSVFYDAGWHNPDLIDTRGISLERIDPDGPGNSPSNWGSNTDIKGGSPGRENSIYQPPGERPEQPGITLSPNPFSPDGDGHEDHLMIHYRLDRPDFLLSVTIFDRYGRRVRKLTDGNRSGYEGSLVWDGRNDSGNRNRIGIYIILFEAFNSSRAERRTFKEVAVLARKL